MLTIVLGCIAYIFNRGVNASKVNLLKTEGPVLDKAACNKFFLRLHGEHNVSLVLWKRYGNLLLH